MADLEKVKKAISRQGGTVHDIDPGIVSRVASNIELSRKLVRYEIESINPSTWMGPAQPIQPVAQDTKGRLLDYMVGYNLQQRPRPQEEVPFQVLQQVSYRLAISRLCIETRKDQIEKLQGKFRVKHFGTRPDKKSEEAAKPRIDELEAFFAFPDQEHNFGQWLRMLLEDMFVIDAATVYPVLTNAGKPLSFEVMSGATIVRKIDPDGRTPIPPSVAYQQVLHGIPASDYTRDELVYYPRNLRPNKIYGYSPIEQILVIMNIALRREIFALSYYTEGNIPEALMSAPEAWTPDQIAAFQLYWDDIMEGNLAQRRHMRFIPGGTTFHETHGAVLKDEFDDYLIRVQCYAFSVSPQPLVRIENRSVAETAAKQAQQEGLAPVQKWVCNLMNLLVWKYFGYKDLEYAYEEEEEMSPEVQANVNNTKVRAGQMTLDEWRDADGKDPLEGGLGNKPMIYTGAGAVLLQDVINRTVPSAPNPFGETPPEGKEPIPGQEGDNKPVKPGKGTEKQPEGKGALPGKGKIQTKEELAIEAKKLEKVSADEVTAAASEAQAPTQAQKEAGNYKRGHIIIHGLDISIENAQGSERSGVSDDGTSWESTLAHHYGYIRGTKGKDKDHIDCFIGPNPESEKVYVVDQTKPFGDFDEHKILLGFDSMIAAAKGYLKNYPTDWAGLGSISTATVDELKDWLQSGDTKSPFDGHLAKYGTASSGNYAHEGRPGIGVGGSAARGGNMDKKKDSERSQRAQKTYKPCTRAVQKVAVANEKLFARATGGDHIGDSKPFDVHIKGGKHLVECKSIVRGKNDKITMHPESMERKNNYVKSHGGKAHTIVFDDRTNKVYYKKGLGSFRLNNMQYVGSKSSFKRKIGSLFKIEG